MISGAVALMLASSFFLSPPATGMWAYAELQPSRSIEAQEKACGIREVSMLSSKVFQLVTDGLSDEEMERYRDFELRCAKEYPDATDQERAKLVLELQGIGSERQRRLVSQSWIRLDQDIVHFINISDLSSASSLFKIEDLVTGEYVALLSESKGKDGRSSELIDRLLDPETQSSDTSKIVTELDALGKERRLRVEANGAVIVIDQENKDAASELNAGISLLWDHLPAGMGKRRIEMAIPIFWRAMVDKAHFSGLALRWPVDPRKTPHDLCLTGTFTVGEHGGSLISMEGPPTEILKDYFGKPILPLPDPDLDFVHLVKRIL